MARTTRAFVELLSRLGYERYGAHGFDIGAGVAGEPALLTDDLRSFFRPFRRG